MQALPLVLTGLQTGMQILGGLSQANYAKEVAKNNQQIALENANRVRQEAAISAQDADFDARGQIGSILANAGASGFKVGQGSLALKVNSAKKLAARDRGYTIYKGSVEETGFKRQAFDFGQERRAAKQSRAVIIGSSLISGASKAYGQAKTQGFIS